MDLHLTCWEYNLIFSLIVEKWKKETSPTPTAYKSFLKIISYSTGKKINSTSTKESTFCQHINNYLNINGEGITAGFFYKLNRKMKDGNSDSLIALKQPLATLLFNYLDYDDYDHFKKSGYTITSYTGLYFSKTKSTISEFSLEIRIPPIANGTIFPARYFVATRGFHDNARSIEICGELKHQDKCWTSHSVNGNYFLQLAFHTEVDFPDINAIIGFNQLFGSLVTIGRNNHLINVEFVLLKSGYSDSAKQTIRRYLNIRRNYFVVDIKAHDLDQIETLEFANFSVNSLDHYAGVTFRILSKGSHGQYIQSRFKIEKDYSAVIRVHDVEDGRDLPCFISIDNTDNDTILVYSYLKSRIAKIYTATGIQFKNKLHSDMVLRGAYFVVDSHMAELAGFSFTIVQDETDFSLRRYTQTELIEEGVKDEKLRLLTAELEKL